MASAPGKNTQNTKRKRKNRRLRRLVAVLLLLAAVILVIVLLVRLRGKGGAVVRGCAAFRHDGHDVGIRHRSGNHCGPLRYGYH